MTTHVPSATSERTPRRQLLAQLFDPGTMHTIRSQVTPVTARPGREVPGDGVVGAAGTVGRRPVFAYAYDSTYGAGSLGVAGAYTIMRVLELAGVSRSPVVAFVESAGARLQEGAAALGGFGRVFQEVVRLRDRVPQIAVITGTSAGGGAYAPALMDWLIAVKGSSMFLTGPAVVKEAIGEEIEMLDLGGWRVHAKSGVAHLLAEDEVEATQLVQRLLACLPQACGGVVPSAPPREPSGEDPRACVPRLAREVYDVRRVIRAVVDEGSMLELSSRWARSMFTGLCRLDGQAVGVIANQPRYRGGVIDCDSARKAAEFIAKCDSYRIPIVVFVDTAGFMPGSRQESLGIIHAGAEFIRSFVEATVPRMTVVLRKAYGGAYITMNAKDLGAHLTFAWPDAEIGVMSARSAALIMASTGRHSDGPGRAQAVEQRAADYAKEHIGALAAARRGLIDEVIEPVDTRARLCWALSVMTSGPLAGGAA